MPETSLNLLLAQCRSDEPTQQIAAILDLLDLKAYTSVPTIVELLASPDDLVRSTAAEVLGDLGIQDIEFVGSALIKLLADQEVIVRSEAVDSLGILGYAPAIEPVKSLLSSDIDPIVRASAAETLGDLGDNRVVPELEMALLDTDESVRAYAANSIGLLGNSELLPKLTNYLESEYSLRVKAEIIGAMYRFGEVDALNLLLSLLENADEDLAISMLNILTDLIGRKLPSKLASDAPQICDVLTAISQRFPILSSHAQQIITQLTQLQL